MIFRLLEGDVAQSREIIYYNSNALIQRYTCKRFVMLVSVFITANSVIIRSSSGQKH